MTAGSDKLTLEMKRVLPAAPSDVFAAFSDPNELVKWWGPEGFSTPSLEFHPRVGESYRIEMQPPEGDPFYLTGEFREVGPPARLAYTFVYEDPDPDDVETVVDLSFRNLGESTDHEMVRLSAQPGRRSWASLSDVRGSCPGLGPPSFAHILSAMRLRPPTAAFVAGRGSSCRSPTNRGTI